MNTIPKQSKQIISSNRVLTLALGRRVGSTDGLFDGEGVGDEDGCMVLDEEQNLLGTTLIIHTMNSKT